MQDNSITSLRELLEKMPTAQLDQMLQEELDKEKPDGNAVRMILRVLREREKDMPVEITPEIQEAWEKYRRNTAVIDSREGKRRIPGWLIRIGSVAAILAVMIFAMPQEADAESLFEKLARWTDSVVDFFSPDKANDNLLEYEFTSDNPGLQQVYEAVKELGVTVPVVPTWLPGGYELVECETVNTSQKKGVAANFIDTKDPDNAVLFKVDVYGEDVSHVYQRDESNVDTYEAFGVEHTILRNNNRWVVIWFRDKTECFLTLDCQENTLYEILNSIYVTEDNNETFD